MSNKKKPLPTSIDLSLDVQEIPVILKDKDGNTLNYTMREMNGADRDKYLDSVNARMKYDEEGKPKGINTIEGLKASLLSLCLFDKDGQQPTIEYIQKWPSRSLEKLHEYAQELNALEDEEEAEVTSKNG